MARKISVIINGNNELSAFESGTSLLVFSPVEKVWQAVDEIKYRFNTASSVSEIRDSIRTTILKLEDCRTIIGKTVTGLPYNILERMGFEIFEADVLSERLLEEIDRELQADSAKAAEADSVHATPTSPVPTLTTGVYHLNLIELQEKYPEISSKKALQSFIETTPFYKLEVVCSHIPPWFDAILPQKRMTYTVEELDTNKLKVSIFKKVCEC